MNAAAALMGIFGMKRVSAEKHRMKRKRLKYKALPEDATPETLDTLHVTGASHVYMEYLDSGCLIMDFIKGKELVRLTLWTKRGAKILGLLEEDS